VRGGGSYAQDHAGHGDRAGPKTIKDPHRANICFQSATTTEVNLADYFRGQKKQQPPSWPAAARP
jgi:hypothetical protein